MYFELLVLLTFALSYSISATPTEETYNQTHYKNLLGKAFAADRAGHIISLYLSIDQLKKVANDSDLYECASKKLDRRSKKMFHQNATMKPKYLAKALEIISAMNFTDYKVTKDFRLLPLLTFDVITAILAAEGPYQTYMECLFEKVFAAGPAGCMITKYSNTHQLEKMADFPDMSGCANAELDHRTKIAFYQNGAMKPTYLGKINEVISSMDFENNVSLRNRFSDHYWPPDSAILFNNEQSMRSIAGLGLHKVLMFVSYVDHLSIIGKGIDVNASFIFPTGMKDNGIPMNGFIFPRHMRNTIILFRKINDFVSNETCSSVVPWYLKLAIVIDNEGEEQGIAKTNASAAAENIRRNSDDASICIVAQTDKRPVKTEYEMGKEGQVLLFNGRNMHSSIHLVGKNDTEETLKAKFEDWKKNLTFLDSHQTVAFHLTVVNGAEPENSEDLFREILPDVPLSTFRLLDNSSTVGAMKGFDFHEGAVFAIVGFPKYGWWEP